MPKAPLWPVLVAAKSLSPNAGMSVPVGKGMEFGESRFKLKGPWKEGKPEAVLAKAARRREGRKEYILVDIKSRNWMKKGAAMNGGE